MASASRRASPTPRRILAIKHLDGEPLTRVDVQYDLLHEIFSNEQEVFTDPFAPKDDPEPPKISFKDLYIKAIFNSPKATKALKDKMKESSVFSLDFAMLSLLVNVGRVNTTMSFFPEMKTTIRTYHPIPCLQHTNGNMQDAPRIKHILKTSLLEAEAKNPPATPADILVRCKSGQPPSTSVTNLLFVLAHHTAPVGASYFQGVFDFIDLFLRTDVSSSSRAKTFLWLCFNYLEAPFSEDDYDGESILNPFGDTADNSGPPALVYMGSEDIALENQETTEDNLTCEKLLAQRTRVVQNQSIKESLTKGNTGKSSVNGSVIGDEDDAPVTTEEPKGKRSRASASTKEKRLAAATKDKKVVKPKEPIVKEREREPLMAHLPSLDDTSDSEDDDSMNNLIRYRELSKHQPYVPKSYEHSVSNGTNGTYRRVGTLESTTNGSSSRRFAPYTSPLKDGELNRLPRSLTIGQPRTMLQQAWHVISSTDPLMDSDDEAGDEHVREDYVQRLRVIDRLSRQKWLRDPLSRSAEMDVDQPH